MKWAFGSPFTCDADSCKNNGLWPRWKVPVAVTSRLAASSEEKFFFFFLITAIVWVLLSVIFHFPYFYSECQEERQAPLLLCSLSSTQCCVLKLRGYFLWLNIQSLKKGYTSILNRPYETIHLEDRFSGIQHAAIALTCWDQINEDWRFPKM